MQAVTGKQGNEFLINGVKHLWAALSAIALWSSCAGEICAFTLDWDSVNWSSSQQWGDGDGATPNPATTTFNNVNGSGVNITISVSRGPNTTEIEAQAGEGGTYPTDTNNPVTIAALLPDPQSLQVSLDSTNTGDSSKLDLSYADETGDDYLLFTISFSKAVYGVNFELWDIDLGNSITSQYQDLVLFSTEVAAPTLGVVATDAINGQDLEVFTAADAGYTGFRGRGTHTSATNFSTTALGSENDTLGTARGSVSYGTNILTTISFKYGAGTGALNSGTNITLGDATLQRITLADIQFSVIPEAGTALAGACLFGIAALRRYRRVSR